ncbi:hypothetical protein [Pontibacter harenae]|uniref:hypothetical protein n=1 Tax=Pontibacter harenae TaxID=2894083 RepID=UPI001E3D6717|nr:hypothetical protein [Pontibacter harenae]MCC9167273.1 hypothetical protein [Pontibacter harenae]
MIIDNPIVKLDYDIAKDILCVEWPNVHDYSISETTYVLDTIVSTIRYYDIKSLLTDTRKGIIGITSQQYLEIIFKFAQDLAKTRIEKLARVVTEETLRAQQISEVSQKANLTVPIRNFSDFDEAVAWLCQR